MQPQQEPRKSPSNRLIKKLAQSRFFTFSLLFHVVLISIVGSFVLFEASQNQDAFTAIGAEGTFLQESDAPEEAQEMPQEFEDPTAVPMQETDPSSVSPQSALSTLAESPSNWTTSASMDQMRVGSSVSAASMNRLSTGSATASGKSSGGSSSGKMSGTLCGVKVETSKLGVILDVSGSAHAYLRHALKEVERFKGAEIVLYPGCGMGGNSKDKDYHMAPAKPAYDRFNRDARQGAGVFGQIVPWIQKYPDEEAGIKKLIASDATYVSINEPGSRTSLGCRFAFEHLIRDGVDTIYWFADFGDEMDAKAAEELAFQLKSKGIKVIAHNFTGAAVRPEALILVEKTGGKAISKIPVDKDK